MSINAKLLKTISLSVKDKSNQDIVNDILKSCLDYATFGKTKYVSDLHSYRVDQNDIEFIVRHFNSLNFDVSSRFIEEDGYYEITVRW